MKMPNCLKKSILANNIKSEDPNVVAAPEITESATADNISCVRSALVKAPEL